MKLATIYKQPGERFSYTANYEDALTTGDNVQSAVASVSPVGLVVDNVGVYDPRVRIWVSGGVDGVIYKVTLNVTTADGRVFQDELVFKIKEL